MESLDPSELQPQVSPLQRIGRILLYLGNQVAYPIHDYQSDHYRGGAAMLDRQLYDKDQA